MNTILPLGQKKVGADAYRAFSVDNKYVITKQENLALDVFSFSFLVYSSPESFEAAFESPENLTGWSLTSVADLKVNVADILYKQSTLTEIY